MRIRQSTIDKAMDKFEDGIGIVVLPLLTIIFRVGFGKLFFSHLKLFPLLMFCSSFLSMSHTLKDEIVELWNLYFILSIIFIFLDWLCRDEDYLGD